MQENWYELMETVQRKQELERVLACNEKTKSFGLTLTEEDAGRLMAGRRDSLRTQMRVEFGKGVLPEIIETFCDSPYLQQENYADVIAELQEIFYLYKNESEDNLTDEELLTFMKNSLTASVTVPSPIWRKRAWNVLRGRFAPDTGITWRTVERESTRNFHRKHVGTGISFWRHSLTCSVRRRTWTIRWKNCCQLSENLRKSIPVFPAPPSPMRRHSS